MFEMYLIWGKSEYNLKKLFFGYEFESYRDFMVSGYLITSQRETDHLHSGSFMGPPSENRAAWTQSLCLRHPALRGKYEGKWAGPQLRNRIWPCSACQHQEYLSKFWGSASGGIYILNSSYGNAALCSN